MTPKHRRILRLRQRVAEKERSPDEPFPVAGIGASAGGLEAFSQLLAHLADDTGMAFVLVQHLDPKHESKLGDLLARTTHIPIRRRRTGWRFGPTTSTSFPATRR